MQNREMGTLTDRRELEEFLINIQKGERHDRLYVQDISEIFLPDDDKHQIILHRFNMLHSDTNTKEEGE
jgi:hypothetical protein